MVRKWYAVSQFQPTSFDKPNTREILQPPFYPFSSYSRVVPIYDSLVMCMSMVFLIVEFFLVISLSFDVPRSGEIASVGFRLDTRNCDCEFWDRFRPIFRSWKYWKINRERAKLAPMIVKCSSKLLSLLVLLKIPGQCDQMFTLPILWLWQDSLFIILSSIWRKIT